MNDSMADPMAAEFDTVAGWTAQVCAELDPAYRIPAGCRGSGSPGALRWLLGRLDPAPGQTFLDCGAGVGGPAAFAAREAGVAPVLTDPEMGACRAAHSLFGLPAVRAAGRLPFAGGTIQAGWSLGVLCTVEDQPAFLDELRRVLHPDGRFGLLVYVATHSGRLRLPTPDGNNFPTKGGLASMVEAASLRVEASGRADDFASVSPAWSEAVTVVEAELRRRHEHDARWQLADQQAARMARLLGSGEMSGVLLVLRRSDVGGHQRVPAGSR